MTYNVLSGTLSFYTTTTTLDHFFCVLPITVMWLLWGL